MAGGSASRGERKERNASGSVSRGIPTRSVSRAIQILQLINRHGNPTMMEIRSETQLPYATVHRLTSTLVYEGLLECDPSSKRYRPTDLVWSLGMGFQKDDQLAAIARPELARLSREFLWPVAMSVRVGDRMVVRDSTHTQTTQTYINYYPGYSLPLLSCGAGKAYLAFCPKEEREILLGAFRDNADEETAWNLHVIEDEAYLPGIREQGYASHARQQHNETPGKTSSVAVPLFVDGRLRACLALVYFDNSMRPQVAAQRYVPALKTASARISRALAQRR